MRESLAMFAVLFQVFIVQCNFSLLPSENSTTVSLVRGSSPLICTLIFAAIVEISWSRTSPSSSLFVEQFLLPEVLRESSKFNPEGYEIWESWRDNWFPSLKDDYLLVKVVRFVT